MTSLPTALFSWLLRQGLPQDIAQSYDEKGRRATPDGPSLLRNPHATKLVTECLSTMASKCSEDACPT